MFDVYKFPKTLIFAPLLFFLLYAPFSESLDLWTSHLFYKQGSFTNHPFYDFIYYYALIPAWIVSLGALLAFCLSWILRKREWRKPSLYLVLVLAIGSGLFVHALFKDHWGRPRPKQTIEFGGSQPYRPFYSPRVSSDPSKSFTCGHCSLGFYFFSVAIMGSVMKSKKLFWIGFSFAWILGILLSLTRIAQGGHYLSDTLGSALIMWLTAYILGYYFLKEQKDERFNT